MEAAWGRADPVSGKLDPSTVDSPRKTEVIIRGNPVADPTQAGGTGSGYPAEQAVALSMDETQ